MFKYINLQMFADGGGALVNRTDGYVNAYTGNYTSGTGMNPTMKTFYDTQLLENYRRKAVYGQFGKKVPLPAGNGKTVEFRKWNTFQRASQLQESVS